jgi:hypothetical protein
MNATLEDFRNAVKALGFIQRNTEYYYHDDEYIQYWTHPNEAEVELYHDGVLELSSRSLYKNQRTLTTSPFKIELHDYRLAAVKEADKYEKGLKAYCSRFSKTKHGDEWAYDWVFAMRRSEHGTNLAYLNGADFSPDLYAKLKPRILELYSLY